MEKVCIEDGSPFTWSEKETLAELERPERVMQIKKDYEFKLKRAEQLADKYKNALRVDLVDIDDVYGVDEGNNSCNICHK